MRLELRDINGHNYGIDTTDSHVIAQWMAEYFPKIVQAIKDTGIPWQLYIYPRTTEESQQFGFNSGMGKVLDARGLQELGESFHAAAESAAGLR